MGINNLDDYISSTKQYLINYRSQTRTSKIGEPFSVFDLAGSYGGGTLNAGNTATGIVPVNTASGYPDLVPFTSGTVGYLSRIVSTNSVASRLAVFDRLWVAGAHPFNVNAPYSSQPSFSHRVPAGDYSGLMLCIEAVTAFTGTPSFNITYVSQSGVTGRTTGAYAAPGAMSVGQCLFVPLAAGDTGVQKVTNIVATGATAGTFNVSVLRPLWDGRVPFPNDGDNHDFLRTGMPQVFDTTSLYVLVYPDGTSTGNIWLGMEIAVK